MSRVTSGARRVNRGGSWRFFPQYAWVAFRSGGVPGFRLSLLGLRLARRLP